VQLLAEAVEDDVTYLQRNAVTYQRRAPLRRKSNEHPFGWQRNIGNARSCLSCMEQVQVRELHPGQASLKLPGLQSQQVRRRRQVGLVVIETGEESRTAAPHRPPFLLLSCDMASPASYGCVRNQLESRMIISSLPNDSRTPELVL
jgi:hypothetical protein